LPSFMGSATPKVLPRHDKPTPSRSRADERCRSAEFRQLAERLVLSVKGFYEAPIGL
jgi:hypothetical protein